jgi:hypothetical protein
LIRKLFPILSLALSAFLIGCGGGGGGSSLNLTKVQVDEGRAARKTIDETGGVLTTTGADGVVYTLTIPAGALSEPTEIAIYPVSKFAQNLFSGGLDAGAHMTPEGQLFAKPVTLAMQLKTAPNPADTWGFGYEGDAVEPHLVPMTVTGSTVSMKLRHFSGGGAGHGSWVPAEPTRAEHFAYQSIAIVLRRHPNMGPEQWDFIANDIMAEWFTTHFTGAKSLRNLDSLTRPLRIAAILDFFSWRTIVDQYPEVYQRLSSLYGTGQLDLISGVKAAIGNENTVQCGLVADVQEAINADGPVRHILNLQRVSEMALSDDGSLSLANQLDLRTVLSQLCVEIKLDAQFPQTLEVGTAGTLKLKAGYVLKAKPNDVEYEATMAVTVLVRNATDNSTQRGTVNKPYGGDPYIHSWSRAGAANPLNLFISVKPVTPSLLKFMLAEKTIEAGSAQKTGLAGLVGYEFTGWLKTYQNGVIVQPEYGRQQRWNIAREGTGYVMTVYNAPLPVLFASGPIVELTPTRFSWTSDPSTVWDVTNDANGFRATISRNVAGPPSYTTMLELTTN